MDDGFILGYLIRLVAVDRSMASVTLECVKLQEKGRFSEMIIKHQITSFQISKIHPKFMKQYHLNVTKKTHLVFIDIHQPTINLNPSSTIICLVKVNTLRLFVVASWIWKMPSAW